MQARIDREDIAVERSDAIKVRAYLAKDVNLAEYSRQCVKSPQIEPASCLLEEQKKGSMFSNARLTIARA